MLKFRILVPFFALIATVSAHAAADKQAFIGGGLGFEVLAKDGSGTGFYVQGNGGYNFNSLVGIGLSAGYSKVSSVNVKVFDFGGFLQLTEADSGIYGRILLGGVQGTVPGGSKRNGVNGTQLGIAPGAALGILIPSAGDFHMVPELAYRAAFLENMVNLITGTFNLVWDF